MTNDPPPPNRSGLSRRDFVLGRVLRRTATETKAPPEVAAAPSTASPSMRYPRSQEDVSNADRLATTGGAKTSEAAARRRAIPLFRPPGAIDEPSFLAGCTHCELCIEACPHQAIVHAPPQLREAAGTPTIDADRQPCLMCADLPCIVACEPNVLSELLPIRMGTARITEHLCLPHHGKRCTVCDDACPVENAIVTKDGKPTIDEETCTGCGVCRRVCPAPDNAILLMPMFIRPVLPNSGDSA